MELPGGRIEVGESPEECVSREIFEETRWKVTTGPLLDTWMYYIDAAEKHVFIVTYGCFPEDAGDPVLSHEHKEVGLFAEREVSTLSMPEGYKRSIAAWYRTSAIGHDTVALRSHAASDATARATTRSSRQVT